MKKIRIPDAMSASRPRTTMTAMAQCGNGDPLLFDCMLPLPLPVGAGVAPDRLPLAEGVKMDDWVAAAADEDAAIAEEREAADDDEAAAADDDEAAADVEDIAAATESAKVV